MNRVQSKRSMRPFLHGLLSDPGLRPAQYYGTGFDLSTGSGVDASASMWVLYVGAMCVHDGQRSHLYPSPCRSVIHNPRVLRRLAEECQSSSSGVRSGVFFDRLAMQVSQREIPFRPSSELEHCLRLDDFASCAYI